MNTILFEPFMQIFITLETKEANEFGAYLSGFTNEKNAMKLYQYCKKHHKKAKKIEKSNAEDKPNNLENKSDKKNKEAIWEVKKVCKEVFNNGDTAERQLRDALNSLLKHIKNFLIIEIAKEDRNKGLILLEAYRRKNLSGAFEEQLQLLKDKETSGIWDIWRKIPLGYKAYYDNTDSKTGKSIEEFNYTLAQIEALTLTLKWKFACEIAMRSKLGFSEQEDIAELEKASKMYNNKWIELYKACYIFIKKPTEEAFRETDKLLRKILGEQVDKKNLDEEIVCVFGFLINIGLSLYNNDKLSALAVLNLIKEVGFAENIIRYESMTADFFLTYNSLLCGEKRFDEAEQVVAIFKSYHPYHKSTLLLAKSLMHLYKNEFSEAKEQLKHVAFKIPSEKFSQRIILICCNFISYVNALEQLNQKMYVVPVGGVEYEDEYFKQFEALKKYLSMEVTKTKKSKMQENYKSRTLNLMRTLRLFTKIEMDERTLMQAIQKKSNLPAKKWILQNLNPILTKIAG